MQNSPFVSVIMPVFNGAEYIIEAINSIIQQSYQNFEIIVIDDGSTDNSIELVKALGCDSVKIVINEQNIGLAASRNRGLAVAEGDYIALMDCDDVSFPHRFATQVAYLEANPDCGMVSSHYITFRNDLATGKRSIKKVPTDSDYIAARLLFQSVICCPCVMLRSETLRQHSLMFNETLRVCEDWDMWYRVSKIAVSVLRTPPSYSICSQAG